MNRQRLLERFLEYVKIDTTAQPETEDYPSSPGQRELGGLIRGHLERAGLTAEQDEHGLVWATLPGTVAHTAPTVAFCAHLDTSPELPGKGVQPRVIENYRGGDIPLPQAPGRAISERDNPALREAVGCTVITADGTTLLGADDKSGLAAIVEAVTWLAEHPEFPHAPVRVCLTCDEEIGRGVDHIEPDRLGAIACYTLDGQGTDRIDVETFSADEAVVSIQGVNIHPAIAKDRMTNALRVAATLVDRLPRERLAPECTAGREGFVHPYKLEASVEKAILKILLRDFDTRQLAQQADLLHRIADKIRTEFPQAQITIHIRPQYRNLADGLRCEPRAVSYAEQALGRLGRTPSRTIVRGGTDGSLLTAMGVPTPNLSTGQYNPHSVCEWACLEHMLIAAEWVANIAQRWGEDETPST